MNNSSESFPSVPSTSPASPSATQPTPQIAAVVSRMFGQNTYVAWWPGRADCLVDDPGFDSDKLFAFLEERQLTPAAILITHGHVDHIAGNHAVKQRWPDCPLVIGRGDADKLTDPMKNLSGLYDYNIVSPPADKLLDQGDVYSAAGFRLEVRDVPGHSSGHIVFVCLDIRPAIVFGGDVLFSGSVGRTDFPGGDFDQLHRAIHSQLFTLPDDTVVLPGHGGHTTIGIEKRQNPYVGLGR